ncbi:MAG: hypothetical protein IJ960_03100 [Oscillospiraceae bacterium]|nr:hypothetical protein [Oscillospiraceae bacterium]
MSVTHSQVFDYLNSHPILQFEGDFESLLDMIYYIYLESNPIDTPEIRGIFQQLDSVIQALHIPQQDALFDAVCKLCIGHSQIAFS